MQKLKPCPCGKTPETLHIADNGSKWAYVSGNCCNGWSIEFRTQYNRIETDECMALAIEAWNEAERSSLLTPDAVDLALCNCKIPVVNVNSGICLWCKKPYSPNH